LDKIAALPTGTKLVLGAGVLLFLDLFLTWQSLPVDYGRFTVTRGLDGWDFWGLLIGLLTLALLAVVILQQMEFEEFEFDGRWDLVPLGLGGLILLLTLGKNLGDSHSTVQSYVGVVLASVVAVGAYLDWSRTRSGEVPVHSAWRPQPAGPSESSAVRERKTDETQSKW
jgi:hypothetical protein